MWKMKLFFFFFEIQKYDINSLSTEDLINCLKKNARTLFFGMIRKKKREIHKKNNNI